MAYTVSEVLTMIRTRYPDMPSATAKSYLQAAHNEISEIVRLTEDLENVGLVANQGQYAINQDVIRIWDCVLQSPSQAIPAPRAISIQEIEASDSYFRSSNVGIPATYFQQMTSAGVFGVGLSPIPQYSTIVVSGATNASPIVITTTAAHGLTDQTWVRVVGVLGNTAANGTYYAKVTGYTSTTFALYSDAALTTPVAGSGVYTSGGFVATEKAPVLQFIVSRRQTLDTSAGAGIYTSLPEAVRDPEAHIQWVFRKWAALRHPEAEQEHDNRYRLALSNLQRRRINFISGVERKVTPVFSKVAKTI